jgi:hypothetical protein
MHGQIALCSLRSRVRMGEDAQSARLVTEHGSILRPQRSSVSRLKSGRVLTWCLCKSPTPHEHVVRVGRLHQCRSIRIRRFFRVACLCWHAHAAACPKEPSSPRSRTSAVSHLNHTGPVVSFPHAPHSPAPLTTHHHPTHPTLQSKCLRADPIL